MTVRLFISNLPYRVTGEDLKQLFSTVGPVSYVYLPIDQTTGKQRGFAFLDFNERAHAEEAVRRFNNHMFMGRPMAVSEARAREDRPRAGSSSGRTPPPSPPAQQNTSDPAKHRKEVGHTFGADDPPRRTRAKPKGKAKSERAPKTPMREVVKGQFFGGEEDDTSGDDWGDENFASRVDQVEDEEKT